MLGCNAYSISRPGHRWKPNFVPDSMTHVPRFRANVSTTHKYNVGSAMGRIVFDAGRATMN